MRIQLAVFLALSWLLCGCEKPQAKFQIPPPQYPTLTLEILKGLPDEKLESAVLDHINSKIGEDYDNSFKIVTALSKGFQMVYATWWVEAEVSNGGFNQYFWNSSGQFRREALEGYKLIGAFEHEKIVADALTTYTSIEGELKKQQDKGTMEAFSESYKNNPLNKLDDQFYALKEDTSALRIKFIRAHLDLFLSK